MNTTTTISDVERINDAGTYKHYDLDGRVYYTRLITCHGGGRTVTLILHANTSEALELLPRKSIEADLAKMDTDTLDALVNAVRAERQSRDTFMADGSYRPGALPPEVEIAPAGPVVLPRDCPGVTVTEDDGLPF